MRVFKGEVDFCTGTLVRRPPAASLLCEIVRIKAIEAQLDLGHFYKKSLEKVFKPNTRPQVKFLMIPQIPSQPFNSTGRLVVLVLKS